MINWYLSGIKIDGDVVLYWLHRYDGASQEDFSHVQYSKFVERLRLAEVGAFE